MAPPHFYAGWRGGCHWLWLVLLAGALGWVALPAATPVITEFMAQNKSVLADEDGQYLDWIELHNPGAEALDLGGHHLTDRPDFPAQWRLPTGVVVPAGGYKIVFASGKDRTNAAATLHTNFRLNKAGGYLALVAPDGLTVLQSFDPYPALAENVSFGPGTASERLVLANSNTWLRARVPADDADGVAWAGGAEPYDDALWAGGWPALGYDQGTPANLYGALIRTDVRAAMANRATVQARLPFWVPDSAEGFTNLVLRVQYDDGFIAWLNGTEVARRNAPPAPAWYAAAPTNRADALGLQAEELDLSAAAPALAAGTNLLAVQLFSHTNNAPRLLLAAELAGVKVHVTNVAFSTPTPGAVNSRGLLPVLPAVEFSEASQLFTGGLSLVLSHPLPEAAIYYTVNGAVPEEGKSARYTGPLAITNSAQVRARAFRPGYAASAVASTHYLKRGTDLDGFVSPLPVLVLHNYGGGPVPGVSSRGPNGDGSQVVQAAFQPQVLAILDRGANGLTALTGPLATASRAGLRLHGSSTFNNTKKSYTLELWGETNDADRKESLLGLPAESDWILYGPSWRNHTGGRDYDASLLHNAFIYELANRSGYYAPRTRFVEVFLNTNGGPVTLAHYAGLYLLAEKVKRAPGRVDFAALADDGSSGGWMINADRMDSLPPGTPLGGAAPRHFHTAGPDGILQTTNDNPRGFKGITQLVAGGIQTDTSGIDPARDDMPSRYHSFFNFESPDAWRITSAQRAAIEGAMRAFDAALYGPNYRDPAAGYAAHIDVDNWVHHFILHNFPKNQDGETLSTYFYRESAAARIKHGPIWDFDRAYNMHPTNPNPATDLEWLRGRLFYLRLFSDPDFMQAYIDKWQALRRGPFADAGLLAIVDDQANEITAAVPLREGMTDWPARLAAFKGWLTNRAAALDAQFLQPPRFAQPGGAISNGFTVVLTNPNPAGAVFFTTDGADPRARGGGVAAGARAWPQSIVLNATTVVRARVWNGTKWSGPAEAVFQAPQDFRALALTEIMYHPPAIGLTNGEEFEFVELRNTGTNTLNLSGLQFAQGIYHTFANGALLEPGAFYLLARNPAALAQKYPGVSVQGVYTGRLDNAGETLALLTGLGTPVFSVTYSDAAPWPAAADGHGFSLVPVEPELSQAPESGRRWRASSAWGGSPGAADPPNGLPAVVINEVLTASSPPDLDAIELFNPTAETVDLSGWFLTDDRSWPRKFRLPDFTVLSPGGVVVFTETDFNPTPGLNLSFSLSSQGEQVYLFSADASGNLTGYSHGFAFGAAARGESFGRVLNSVGDEGLVPQAALTLGAANAGPRVGPLVISEIMYHPFGDGVEYLEVVNISADAVALFDREWPTNTWRISGANFVFPSGVLLPPGGVALVAGTNPAVFRALHTVPPETPVFGPLGGVLQNSGEFLQLERPGPPATNGLVPYYLVDQVRYNDRAPWPAAADGSGQSLHRLDLAAYGDDPANWFAADPTPGAGPDHDGDGLPDAWEIAHGTDPAAPDAGIDPDGDGASNGQEFLAGTHPRDAASVLAMQLAAPDRQAVVITFTAMAGRTYAAQFTDSLTNGWQTLAILPAQSTNRVERIVDPGSSATRFYRLTTPAAP